MKAMKKTPKHALEGMIEAGAAHIGVRPEDLRGIAEKGELKTYDAGAWLFHESSPRLWIGFVVEGQVDIVRGLHGNQVHLASLGRGALIGEAALLDDSAHSTGAFAPKGAAVYQIPRRELEAVRQSKPDVFYRLVAQVARRISERLRYTSEKLLGEGAAETLLQNVRWEHDLLGEREVPNHAYYGVQTIRALENFPISGTPLKNFRHFVNALAYVKKAAAMANSELGVLAKEKMKVIAAACDEILKGALHEHFVVDMIQGGAGTSTNMNANEVIANRALEIMGHNKGEYKHLHPNDDVNCSQSTNDAYPTAIKLAVVFSAKDTVGAMAELKAALEAKASEFADVLKMGRTENQDAVPMTLGQEFAAYAVMVGDAIRAVHQASEEFYEINMGATAIGTGINSPPGYAELVTRKLSKLTGLPLHKAENLVEATQEGGSFAQMSGNLKRAAVQISKICNDLRWLSSGPRCGLYEITLPPMQPGSSIMPGKVNPVIPEMVSQVCYQIVGYDMTISMGAEASELELNMAEPIVAYDLLHGLMILKNACIVLTSRCIVGIKANRDRCRQYVENSIGLVTALNPVLGYEKSVAIAKEALESGRSVYELVLEKKWLSKKALDDILKPENMTNPRQIPR
ncbi:MAG: aspartate ammonia-lyase [Desulfobacterota bacterium]|jgi:aspartate ammonia-lyase|nr:aspartate ammonia-lyase [Thermodesulfobacteriota bacterium]